MNCENCGKLHKNTKYNICNECGKCHCKFSSYLIECSKCSSFLESSKKGNKGYMIHTIKYLERIIKYGQCDRYENGKIFIDYWVLIINPLKKTKRFHNNLINCNKRFNDFPIILKEMMLNELWI